MTDPSFADLVLALVRTPNPQHLVDGRPGEQRLLDHVSAWLSARLIFHVCDPQWGLFATLTGPLGAGEPGILLSAHLDSDHLDVRDLQSVRIEGDSLLCAGEVGLDCKTGVAIVLSVLQRLQDGEAAQMPPRWQVHALFTVGEESGQKGAFRAPLPQLLPGKARHAVVIDRQTRGRGAPQCARGEPLRHCVTVYKGVPLCAEGDPLLLHLSAGSARAAGGGAAPQPMPTCESPNCADALELRGRWVGEVAAPAVLSHLSAAGGEAAAAAAASLEKLLGAYRATSAAVASAMGAVAPEARVSSMNAPPRITRYVAMAQLGAALDEACAAGLVPAALQEELAFSCVNLSYDYDDAWDACSLAELDATARIVLGACESYFCAR